MDISNDQEAERLGANATAVYAWNFWERLSNATRQDGSRWLSVEERNFEEIHHIEERALQNLQQNEAQTQLSATCQLILTDTVESDKRLYQRFRSNFGGMNVRQLSYSDLSGPRWQSLLVASEGIIDSYNFMTLLRLDAHDIFWMTDTEASHGIAVVPRAQFIYVELARLREGIYDSSSFRHKLHQWDITCWTEDLWLAWKHQDDSSAVNILNLLRNQWRYPNSSILKETGVLSAVRYGWKSSSSEIIRKQCYELLQYWQDIWELTKMLRKASSPIQQRTAIQRAAHALAFPEQKQDGISRMKTNTNSFTGTTSSLEDLIPSKLSSAPNIFSVYGMVILREFLNPSQVDECKCVAYSCLQALVDEQLTPRGLIVDGSNTFDFTEVRQRPGHRVDNRYKVMDSQIIQDLGTRLLEELPAILNTSQKDIHYKLLYGGVVHSFPRATKSAAIPDA